MKMCLDNSEDFITLPKISQVFGEVRLGLALVAVFFRMNKETVVMHLWRNET